jgi:hypothetical protein
MVHEVFYFLSFGRGDVYGIAKAFHLWFGIIPGIVNVAVPANKNAVVL